MKPLLYGVGRPNLWGRSVLILWMSIQACMSQLAITEVMSDASEVVLPKRPDFWELTNFGTERIDLSSYRWSDSSGIEAADPLFFQNRSIGPGESVLLVRSNVVTTLTTDQVLDWWGRANFISPLQVFFYRGPGFSQDYDAVQLWRVSNESTQLVDRVDFYQASTGHTFTYDPDTGRFGAVSESGVRGAFRASAGLDIGSPGRTTGPIPLRILEAPLSTEVDAGSEAEFKVLVQGLPRARYQWFHNGSPIAGAVQPSLRIGQAIEKDEGDYVMELSNGLETIRSKPAQLKVSRVPSCVRVLVPPADLSVTPGQTARFEVIARGYPLPRYQWLHNGMEIPGANESSITLTGVDFSDTGEIEVQLENELCSTNLVAQLAVLPPPDLRVTEVMSAPSTNAPFVARGDWWELTNFEKHPVSIQGYRFDDAPGVLDGAVTFTRPIIMAPGESVVFISDQTREDFIAWWGIENLPPQLQIIPYAGNAFDQFGDALYLWNATALLRDDFILSLSFVNEYRGVSLWFDRDLAEFGESSVAGERGAFVASRGGDIGSPGWITNRPPRVELPVLTITSSSNTEVVLSWKTLPGHSYLLQVANSCQPDRWVAWSLMVAEGSSMSVNDPVPEGERRFYRLIMDPEGPSP